jgi:hypothetical protein
MLEYKVRRIDGDGTNDIEKACNHVAKDGWRLVTTSGGGSGHPEHLRVPVLRAGATRARQRVARRSARARQAAGLGGNAKAIRLG